MGPLRSFILQSQFHRHTKEEPKICGENLTWSFNNVTNVLTISGSGNMTHYSGYSAAPWGIYSNSIEIITIENEVTSIGSFSFYSCTKLTSITIPDSVTSIGFSAFFFVQV